jgi:hypothetical protein
MSKFHLFSRFLIPWLVIALAACAPQATPAAPTATNPPANTLAPTAIPPSATATTAPTLTPGATSQASSFSDPFAYCAAAGTADTPDVRYTGPRMPDSLAQGLKKASGASADAPIEMFTTGAYWRCMDGKVYACTIGANLP